MTFLFYLMKKAYSRIFISSVPPPRAGPDYELFPGMGYYKLHTTPRTWNEALRTCAVEGAHLAIVNSESEARFLQLLFSRHPKITGGNHNDYAYLGVHDMFSEGQFTTIFGKRMYHVCIICLGITKIFTSSQTFTMRVDL